MSCGPSFFSHAHSCHSLPPPLVPSRSASRPFIYAFTPTNFVSHSSRFCLLTIHLSAQYIPLHLPKLCLKTQFIYFFYCFSATGSLKGKCAGWNRLVILPEPQEFPLGHLTDTFIHNNLRLAVMKELTDFGTQISWKWIIGNCFSCTK